MSLTAIFDIGKTNKKFFLFDEQFQEVENSNIRIDEIEDEDGFPGDDLTTLTEWMRLTLESALNRYGRRITHLNFSTYGATLVHLDEKGLPATALYNYLKPFPEDLLDQFHHTHGAVDRFSLETASPSLGMLNSGLQLYWLKYARPDRFARIKTTLHLPQYCNFLFTGKTFTEYTSIGCHTGLWDFAAGHYHRWVREENLLRLFPALVETTKSMELNYRGFPLKVGVGIHDSSAALLPYLFAEQHPFLLLSTGTWSICLNPFSEKRLTTNELAQDCLNYLRPDGKTVKASRLFLGQEHQTQATALCRRFGQDEEAYRSIRFDRKLYQRIRERRKKCFVWQHLHLFASPDISGKSTVAADFSSLKEAYHQLIWELVDLQVQNLALALGTTPVKRIYIDGGFTGNELYLHMLADRLKDMEIVSAQTAQGSALGAAIAVRNTSLPDRFLEDRFSLRAIRG